MSKRHPELDKVHGYRPRKNGPVHDTPAKSPSSKHRTVATYGKKGHRNERLYRLGWDTSTNAPSDDMPMWFGVAGLLFIGVLVCGLPIAVVVKVLEWMF